jgi:hypothetical protein
MNKNIVNSAWSFFTIIVFIIIGMGYDDITVVKTVTYKDGVYTEHIETAPQYALHDDVDITIKQGRKDEYGQWHGKVTIETWNSAQSGYRETETVTFVHGERHGKSEIKKKYVNGDLVYVYVCYNMGNVIPCTGRFTSYATDLRAGLTAIEILEEKYPWYKFENLPQNQNVRDSFDMFLMAIENKLSTYPISIENFEIIYKEVIGSKPILDSFPNISNWYQLSGRFASGEQEAKNFEFRRAVIERYTKSKTSTAEIIQNVYPYLKSQLVNNYGVKSQDFDAFCDEFDSRMDKKINAPISDPFFIDSLDNWMGQIFTEFIDEGGFTSYSKLKFAMAQPIKSGKRFESAANNLLNDMLQRKLSGDIPVHEAILTLFIKNILDVDVIKLSVKEACLTKQNVPLLPEIVTNILSFNTEGIRVRGLVTFDGNDAIIKSGIVWDTVYNPELMPNNITNPENNHDFNAFIGGLIPGKRYFVRSYAVNKAGMSYSITMEFISGEVSSNKDIQYKNVGWKINPNPADDQINITFEEPLPIVEVFIYSMNGYQVFHNRYNNQPEIKINASEWTSGTYTIVLKGPKIHQTKRIIVQR